MKLRFPHEGEEGPFLAGYVECLHVFTVGAPGEPPCAICNGTGWRLHPVVLENDDGG